MSLVIIIILTLMIFILKRVRRIRRARAASEIQPSTDHLNTEDSSRHRSSGSLAADGTSDRGHAIDSHEKDGRREGNPATFGFEEDRNESQNSNDNPLSSGAFSDFSFQQSDTASVESSGKIPVIRVHVQEVMEHPDHVADNWEKREDTVSDFLLDHSPRAFTSIHPITSPGREPIVPAYWDSPSTYPGPNLSRDPKANQCFSLSLAHDSFSRSPTLKSAHRIMSEYSDA
jgi:hypothetical protein